MNKNENLSLFFFPSSFCHPLYDPVSKDLSVSFYLVPLIRRLLNIYIIGVSIPAKILKDSYIATAIIQAIAYIYRYVWKVCVFFSMSISKNWCQYKRWLVYSHLSYNRDRYLRCSGIVASCLCICCCVVWLVAVRMACALYYCVPI